MTDKKAIEILGIHKCKTYRQGYNRYKYLTNKHHPDKGGDPEQFRDLQTAWKQIKDILPKLKLVIMIEGLMGYERWLRDGIHGDWIRYHKKDGKFHLMEPSTSNQYLERIKDEDKILEDGVNCTIRVVSIPEHRNKYSIFELWTL